MYKAPLIVLKANLVLTSDTNSKHFANNYQIPL
jgi:hypothetical protein